MVFSNEKDYQKSQENLKVIADNFLLSNYFNFVLI